MNIQEQIKRILKEETQGVETFIENNWEKLYSKSRIKKIRITVNGDKYSIMGEKWDDGCIYDYLEKTDGDTETEDYEEYLFDVIDYVQTEENWDGYVYIDPEESDELYGITIYYKKVK